MAYFFSFFLMLFALPALASGTAIGIVKTVSGEATVTTNGVTSPAMEGDPVYLRSQLRTGGGESSLGVTFKDETMMSLGPDSEMSVETYYFAPASNRYSLGARLFKGSMNYVSGIIAKLRPEAIELKTPTATIGVRGTRFVIRVED